MSSFIISCGGTGGHLSPGIALAQGLIEKGHKCQLVISHKDVDSRLIDKYPDIEYVRLPGIGFSWNPFKFIQFNFRQLQGFIQSVRHLRKLRPDAIIGFGGFITATVVFAGFILGFPIILHESNRKPGKAIRLLSGFAQRIYLPEGVRLKGIPPQVVRHCGFPLRKEIRELNYEKARKNLGLKNVQGKLLLVLGGSQGAVKLNDWVAENFEKLAEENINVYCLSGIKNNVENLIEHTTKDGATVYAKFVPFSDNMSDVLSSADLVVSRAGAGSIAEFIRCRVPSMLIPYPFSADEHQQANAAFHERQGAGVVIDQKNLESLTEEVIDTIYNDWLLDKFRRNLERLDRYNSIEVIIQDIEAIAEENKEPSD